jgi:hypothetical protein
MANSWQRKYCTEIFNSSERRSEVNKSSVRGEMARHVLWETESSKSAFRTLAPTRFVVSFLVSSGVSLLSRLFLFYYSWGKWRCTGESSLLSPIIVTYLLVKKNIFSRPGLKHILYYFLYFIPF